MKISILFYSLAAMGSASPAPSRLQTKRAHAPAYAAHTIDQPVCDMQSLCDSVQLTMSRLITFKILVVMSPTRKRPSNSATSSILHTTSREDQSSFTLAARQAERVVSQTFRLAVSAQRTTVTNSRTEFSSHSDLDGEVQWPWCDFGESILRSELPLQYQHDRRAAIFDHRTK